VGVAGQIDPRPASARARFPLFDSLRAIAAVSVVVYHAAFYVRGLDGPVTRYLSQHEAGFPAIGVVLFFAISGFLLYRPFVQARYDGTRRPPTGPYAWRRVMRIVPAYWLALTVETIVLGLHGVFTPHGLVTYFGFLQVYDVRTLMGGMGQAWTLDVELTFYAALVALAFAMRRVRAETHRGLIASELGICALLAGASIAWQIGVIEHVSRSSPHYYGALLSLPASMDLFAVGMVLAVLSVARADLRWRALTLLERAPWVAVVVAAGAYWALMHSASLFPGNGAGSWVAPHELRGVMAAGLLVPAVFGPPRRGLIRRFLGWRPLLWVGKISYGVYLWHVLVLVELQRHVGQDLGTVGFLALALILTLALAAASWYGLERHAIRLGRRLSGGRPPRGDRRAYAPSSSR
jgi:peptidoglycan/LPS O-acetylase OafA/YrhL